MGYLLAGFGFLIFGFPFWFLHAVDKMPKGQFTPPFFFVLDDPLAAFRASWMQVLTSLGLLVGSISFWQAGEPTGFGPKRTLLIVPMAGASCYLLAVWVLLPFAPLGAFLNGLGMLLVGYASIKATIWTGWKRYTPLIAGLFPFVFMFPLRFLTGARPAAVIGFWGFAWILLGIASWLRSKEIKPVQLA
jgi:hypothetical protein